MDAVRLAFGTLTIVPLGAPRRVDHRVAGWAMTLAPLVGAVLGLVPLVLWTLAADPLLMAALTVASVAVLDRALHLDGLADTADGLGSRAPAERALTIMKQSDIGPFGVITLVLVLLAQVAALAQAYGDSWARGALAAVVSATAARLALTLAARAGVPAARPEGLGAAVAGVVPVRAAAVAAVVVTGAAAGAGALVSTYDGIRTAAAVLASLAAAELLLRHCTRRFGGVTGDVFGGLAETAATVALVVLSLGQ
jgi:adenosylcobinamide-GDP ribazoletransferase